MTFQDIPLESTIRAERTYRITQSAIKWAPGNWHRDSASLRTRGKLENQAWKYSEIIDGPQSGHYFSRSPTPRRCATWHFFPMSPNSSQCNYESFGSALRLGEQVTHTVFDKPPPSNFASRHSPLWTHTWRPDLFNLKLLSSNPSADTLFPRLGSLEAHLIASFTDGDVLDLIESRINAFKCGEATAIKFSFELSFNDHMWSSEIIW